MMKHLLFFINSMALGVGLAMDAFSVSVANGLREPRMRSRRMLAIAGTYAGFQFLMPLLGWFLVRTAADTFRAVRPFIPYVALLLLVWIGGKMLREGAGQARRQRDAAESGTKKRTNAPASAESQGPLGLWELLGQGIATSIDALSVGFTIAEYRFSSAVVSSSIIAIITFVICLSGLLLGKRFGARHTHRASLLGGCILIAIGLEIFLRGVFF